MPPPYRVLRAVDTPDGQLAAVIPIAALHWTFEHLPETFFYVVGKLEVQASGDWLLGDKPHASVKFPKGAIRSQRGKCTVLR
jgi:hypothetical protein